MGVQQFIHSAEGISSSIIPTTLIFDGEVKIGEGGHPSMPAHIKVRGGKKIGEGIIISLHNERLVNEILLNVVHNSPLKGEELSLARVIVPLSLSQRSASISNGM